MQRWWDDQSASRAALELVDGSDPQRGMGVAVLGFHGIAKAALAPLAGTTLVDPRTMADALSEADFRDVESAIFELANDDLGQVAASKYAELVVEDMRRRTIESSVRLSQTLVNKGMPWPRAITRVAEVAGVPLSALGRYASQVAAPGLDALAVTDYADRALMEHARARAALEPEWSTVSKAKARVRYRQAQREPFNEAEVNRDELGRFAEEHRASAKEQEELEARRARRRKRKKAKARKTTKLVPTGRTATQAVTERTARPSSSNRPTHSNRPIRPEDRPKAGEPIGALGLPMVSLNRLAEHDGPVTVSQTMYVFQDPYNTEADAAGFMGRAYTEEEHEGVLGALVAMTDVKRVVSHRFAPGTLVIQEQVKPDDALSLDYEQSVGATAYLAYLPGENDVVDVVFKPRDSSSAPTSIFSKMPPRDARSMLSFARAKNSTEYYRDAPVSQVHSELDKMPGPKAGRYVPTGLIAVPVIQVDSEMVEREGLWEETEKAARVRYRQQQREPWDESSVNRDELGRFAEEEKATEAELAAIAERKARRRRRKHAKDRRAKIEAERRTQAQPQQQRVEHVQQERTAVPGQRAVPRPTQRAQRRTEMAPEVKAEATKPVRITANKVIAHQARRWMTPDPRSNDHIYVGGRDPLVVDGLEFDAALKTNVTGASLLTQTAQMLAKREYDIKFGATPADETIGARYPLSSYPEARVLHALHQFTSLLSQQTLPAALGAAEMAQRAMLTSGEAFASFMSDRSDAWRSSRRVPDDSSYWDRAVYVDSILGPDTGYAVTRSVGTGGPRTEVWADTKQMSARQAVVIITDRASRVLEKVEELSDPMNNRKVGTNPPPVQKITKLLQKNDLMIERMQTPYLEQLADEVLSLRPGAEVRLDAVDVFRVYVNGERDN